MSSLNLSQKCEQGLLWYITRGTNSRPPLTEAAGYPGRTNETLEGTRIEVMVERPQRIEGLPSDHPDREVTGYIAIFAQADEQTPERHEARLQIVEDMFADPLDLRATLNKPAPPAVDGRAVKDFYVYDFVMEGPARELDGERNWKDSFKFTMLCRGDDAVG